MADEDEVLDDEPIGDGTEGEGAEGQDTGAGDEGSEVSAEQPDAQAAGDDGPQAPSGDGEERPLSRGESRQQRLANELRQVREENARLARERQEERNRQAAQQAQWDQEQWNQRWAVMTPDEKVQTLYEQGQNWMAQTQQNMGLQMQVMRDQMAFDAKATVRPIYAKYKNEVEQIHNQYAARGQFIQREVILKQVIGERALATADKSTSQARKQGQKKIEAQTTRPSGSKGDTASQRGRSGDSPAKRLEGVEI